MIARNKRMHIRFIMKCTREENGNMNEVAEVEKSDVVSDAQHKADQFDDTM